MLERVCKMANALRKLGIKSGDSVIIYMAMTIEGIMAMQACARIGAIHSVVFGGFSAQALRDRIMDVGAVAVITADGQYRGGKALPLKAICDEALFTGECPKVKNVIVSKRTGTDVSMTPGRDVWMQEIVANEAATCEPEWVSAEHPLFILYTSGLPVSQRVFNTLLAATYCGQFFQ
jgi:acetyl-CoA synthetase